MTPIRVVCAPNAFKGTLRAHDAAAAMAAGVREAGGDAVLAPVADGGDGTLEVLLEAAAPAGGVTQHVVTGPLGAPVRARLGWTAADEAVVELAEASGLRVLGDTPPDPLAATSRGTGELVGAALDQGARRIVVAVGGSACTDGGAGLLQALGVRLLDERGDELQSGGAALRALSRLDIAGLDSRLASVRLEVATDVRNPLCGPDGAAAVFGPQKGATPEDVAVLDAGLRRLAEVAERDLGTAGMDLRPGAGAAGGCGFGLALAGAELRPGAALVCDLIGLDARLRGAALMLTGEGRLDAQTALGKAPAEVAARARRQGIPCIAVAGSVAGAPPGMFAATVSLEAMAGSVAAARAAPEKLLRRAAREAAAGLAQ